MNHWIRLKHIDWDKLVIFLLVLFVCWLIQDVDIWRDKAMELRDDNVTMDAYLDMKVERDKWCCDYQKVKAQLQECGKLVKDKNDALYQCQHYSLWALPKPEKITGGH